MGIRIEDEVLVGKEHSVVLSVSAPKEVGIPFSNSRNSDVSTKNERFFFQLD